MGCLMQAKAAKPKSQMAQGGHKYLIEYFISRGASYWNCGMCGAIRGGHKDLVHYFIVKGANKWEWEIGAAIDGGHNDLIEYFRQKLSLTNDNYGIPLRSNLIRQLSFFWINSGNKTLDLIFSIFPK